MKYLRLFVLCVGASLMMQCKKSNNVTKKEVEPISEEWVQLFNGKDLDDWIVKIKGYPLDTNIHNTFRVEDSVIKVSYDGYETFNNSFGHLFYKKPFTNYRLKLQYRFVGEQAPGGEGWAMKNSGVMLHSQAPESMELDQAFPICLEAQFLGGLEKGFERPSGNLCTPGTHVVMKDSLVTDHCINSISGTVYNEDWVDVELLVLNDSLISHMINGKEVIRYSKAVYGGEFLTETEEWQSKVGKPLSSGYIALQSESHPVEFRNIALLELKDIK